MGTWIAQAGPEGYWLQQANSGSSNHRYAEKPCKNRCRVESGRTSSVPKVGEEEEVEEEEESRRRMVELMLGPCKYLCSNTQQRLQYGEEADQLPALDLLNAARTSSLDLMNHFSFAPVSSAMDSTPIELEPDSPLPAGWEKCLDLKTGCIYFLNRRTGWTSPVDPRKVHAYDGKSGLGADLNSWPTSPTTSEITMEASSKSSAKQLPLNMNEKIEEDEGALDLNLSLHVGQSPSKLSPQYASEAGNVCSLVHPAQCKVPSSVPSASSSSSSTTSLPTNSTLPFPHSNMSSKQSRQCPSQDLDSNVNKQVTRHFSWLAPKESMYMSSDHSVPELSQHSTEANQSLECSGHGAYNAPMVTVACANCLMFVMLSRSNPKCPRCGTCPDHFDFPQPLQKRMKLGFFQ